MINQYDTLVDSLQRVQRQGGEPVEVIYDYGAVDAPPVQNQVKMNIPADWPDQEGDLPAPYVLKPLNSRLTHVVSRPGVQLWLTIDTRLNNYRSGRLVQSVQIDSVQIEPRTVVQLDTVLIVQKDIRGSIIWGGGTAVAGLIIFGLFAKWTGWPWR